MYTKNFFDKYMDEFDPPEMQTAPLEKLYVNVKHLSMKLEVRRAIGDRARIARTGFDSDEDQARSLRTPFPLKTLVPLVRFHNEKRK